MILNGYYPTVEELISHNFEEDFAFYRKGIMFYASDPFEDKSNDKEYRRTVKYCQKILEEFKNEC